MIRNLKRVEIELQSFCNRKCAWCPNAVLLRDKSIEMDEELFIRIITELRDNDFTYRERKSVDKYISFNRFSEPMSHIELLKKRLNQALEIMPDAQYLINTNGDYMSREALDGLYLDKLNVMDYDSKGAEYWKAKFIECGIVITSETDSLLMGIHRNVSRVTCELNWTANTTLEDRAGFLKEDIHFKGNKIKWRNDKSERVFMCIEPTFYTSIDFNGNVMPCCHMRSDNPDHEKFIFGNLHNNTLGDILSSEKAADFRLKMGSGDSNIYPQECKNCQKVRGSYMYEIPNVDLDHFKGNLDINIL